MFMMKEPKERFATRKAIDELSEELDMPHEDRMQDRPYEVAEADKIDDYISHYNSITDEDKKFFLMQAIIQATEGHRNEKEIFLEYRETIKPLLEKDFYIHEYTIYQRCCFDNDNIDDCRDITPFMRKLWEEGKKKE